MSEAQAPATPEPGASLLGHNGGPDWLPEELRSVPALGKFKDPAGLAKSYVELEKFVGAPKDRLLRLPDKEGVPEWEEVYARLGRPEKPDEYGLEPNDAIPAEALQAFAAKAHAAGMNKRQVADVLGHYTEVAAQAAEARQKADEAAAHETLQSLKAEWGAGFDAKVHGINKLLTQFGGEGGIDAALGAGLHRNPALVRMLAGIADTLAEGGSLKGGGGGDGGMTPDAAKDAMQAKYRDTEFTRAYFDKDHAGHAGAVAEMEKLSRMAYPGVQS